MAIYYLETSALLKRYRTEQGTATVNDIFRSKLRNEVLLTSYFTALEVEAVVARALKGRILTREALIALLGRFAEDLNESVALQPVSNIVLSDSIDQVRRYALRAPDAIHLAAALRVSQAALVATIFVTSDNELLRAARNEGLEILDPQHPNAAEHLERFRKDN